MHRTIVSSPYDISSSCLNNRTTRTRSNSLYAAQVKHDHDRTNIYMYIFFLDEGRGESSHPPQAQELPCGPSDPSPGTAARQAEKSVRQPTCHTCTATKRGHSLVAKEATSHQRSWQPYKTESPPGEAAGPPQARKRRVSRRESKHVMMASATIQSVPASKE